MNFWTALLAVAICCSHYGFQIGSADEQDQHYVNEWAAEIPGGADVARSVASQHGYRLVRALQGLTDHYLLERSDVPHRSRRGAAHHTRKLAEDERVSFVAQQQHQVRVKREQVDIADREAVREILASGKPLNDPSSEHQWYINPQSDGASRQDTVRADLRVKECWKKGITGKGASVSILDDGIERTHPDLARNYDPEASYDFNDNDNDPNPRYDPTNENKHGTRCAGEISMVANNNNCGVGIAFDAKIGGVRMLDGRVTDRLEGEALSFNHKHVDIYSASWGPNDDGKTLEGPGLMARRGLELGIKEGRDGKGSLYAWASGNGGRIGDHCNADGYTSSIYTISVSSASQNGNSPWYSERCASTITSAYSSGSQTEGKVISADLHGKCTDSHTGTSAAAPMMAGVMALALEANSNLTWRDMQHIIAHCSRMEPLALESGWYKNGVGYCVNLKFGFGLIDAFCMTELANPATWQHVGEQRICTVEPVESSGFPKEVTPGNYVEVEFTTNGCEGQDNEVNFLEHIQVIMDMDHEKRGKVYAEVQSPMGTITPLFLERKFDSSNRGFKAWPMMSVHNWGEKPEGTWKFRVADRSTTGNEKGSLKSAKLVLYGTKERPAHQSSIVDCGNINKFVEVYSEGDEESKILLRHVILDLQETVDPEVVENKVGQLKDLLNSKVPIKDPQIQHSLVNLVNELEAKKARKFQFQALAENLKDNQMMVNLFSHVYSDLSSYLG
ncbi:unnamed protein product [Lymnaea stagnalis]|uniref:P/Homo B domain-containing protein n=1 Tax=Lymnaea stagnalis TaxID=6523 RepID=A0AAV2IE30_LYMST